MSHDTSVGEVGGLTVPFVAFVIFFFAFFVKDRGFGGKRDITWDKRDKILDKLETNYRKRK
jgi:hypothetical protein